MTAVDATLQGVYCPKMTALEACSTVLLLEEYKLEHEIPWMPYIRGTSMPLTT